MDLTKTFHLNIVSEVDGKTYAGNFTTKKLTLGDYSTVAVLKAQRAGGFINDPASGKGVDSDSAYLNSCIAHCQVALVDKPSWFDPDNLIDVDILQAVYTEVITFENSFRNRKPTSNKHSGDSQVTSSNEPEGDRGPVDDRAKVVDRKVPKITQISGI